MWLSWTVTTLYSQIYLNAFSNLIFVTVSINKQYNLCVIQVYTGMHYVSLTYSYNLNVQIKFVLSKDQVEYAWTHTGRHSVFTFTVAYTIYVKYNFKKLVVNINMYSSNKLQYRTCKSNVWHGNQLTNMCFHNIQLIAIQFICRTLIRVNKFVVN